MKKTVFIDKSAKEFLLQSFDKDVDTDGFIIDGKTKSRVLSFNGEEVHIDEFGGIMKGSVIFLKSDIHSLLKFVEKFDGNN